MSDKLINFSSIKKKVNVTSHTPTYNLKAVLKETGLKADVLRAWERRYDLPKPHRTPGGHRLYSEYDIETIKWLMARQEEGLSISHATELWRSLKASGQEPLQQVQALQRRMGLFNWRGRLKDRLFTLLP